MSMNLFYIILAVLAGSVTALQAGINSQLQQHWAGSAILAATASFIVGALTLIVIVVAARIPIPALPGKTQWWHWLGGFLGAYLVTAIAYLAPRLGATSMISLFLTGQVVTSLIVDQFGLLGYAEKAITWPRFAGLLLVGGGVYLIRRF